MRDRHQNGHGERRSVVIEFDQRTLLVLTSLVALAIGFAGGYWTAGPSTAHAQQHAAHVNCSFQLPQSQQYIIAGLRCPEPGSTDLVVDCHCDQCHRIQSTVKDMLLQGRSPEQIRAAIIEQYGDAVKPAS